MYFTRCREQQPVHYSGNNKRLYNHSKLATVNCYFVTLSTLYTVRLYHNTEAPMFITIPYPYPEINVILSHSMNHKTRNKAFKRSARTKYYCFLEGHPKNGPCQQRGSILEWPSLQQREPFFFRGRGCSTVAQFPFWAFNHGACMISSEINLPWIWTRSMVLVRKCTNVTTKNLITRCLAIQGYLSFN